SAASDCTCERSWTSVSTTRRCSSAASSSCSRSSDEPICESLRSSRWPPASATCASRSARTVCASRAKYSTALSSSRPSRCAAGLDPLDGLRFLDRDSLAQVSLPLAQPLGDFVQGAAPLALVRVELGARGLGDLPCGPLELGHERREPLALLLARGVEPLRIK